MADERRVLGLIPARAGSKGIPRKNLAVVQGKPLVGWVAEEGRRSTLITRVVVSSDSDEIIAAARAHGAEAPFKRPPELARDETLVVDVIAHALRWFQDQQGQEFDYVCLLQPTSPLAKAEDYDRAITRAFEQDADTVLTVYRGDHIHPAIFSFTLDASGKADWLIKPGGCSKMARRQDLPAVYIRCGVAYVLRSSMVLTQRTLYGERVYAVEVPRERGIGIDTPLDLKIADVVMRELLGRGEQA